MNPHALLPVDKDEDLELNSKWGRTAPLAVFVELILIFIFYGFDVSQCYDLAVG